MIVNRIIKYAHMANTILEEYKVRLQKNKIAVVAKYNDRML